MVEIELDENGRVVKREKYGPLMKLPGTLATGWLFGAFWTFFIVGGLWLSEGPQELSTLTWLLIILLGVFVMGSLFGIWQWYEFGEHRFSVTIPNDADENSWLAALARKMGAPDFLKKGDWWVTRASSAKLSPTGTVWIKISDRTATIVGAGRHLRAVQDPNVTGGAERA